MKDMCHIQQSPFPPFHYKGYIVPSHDNYHKEQFLYMLHMLYIWFDDERHLDPLH